MYIVYKRSVDTEAGVLNTAERGQLISYCPARLHSPAYVAWRASTIAD